MSSIQCPLQVHFVLLCHSCFLCLYVIFKVIFRLNFVKIRFNISWKDSSLISREEMRLDNIRMDAQLRRGWVPMESTKHTIL